VPDPYHWLEDVDSDETAQFVAAQNAVTEPILASTPGREVLHATLTTCYNYAKTTLPSKRGSNYIYRFNSGLLNQYVLHKQCSLDSNESSVLLDPNTMDAEGTTALGTTAFNHDGSMLAYAIAKAGSDWNSIHVRNVETAEDTGDNVSWVKFSGIQWFKDQGFFYSSYRAPDDRPPMTDKAGTETTADANSLLCFHRIGTPESEDLVIFKDPINPGWMFHGQVTDDDKYLLISVNNSCDPVNQLYVTPLPDDMASVPRDDDGNIQVQRLFTTFEAEYEYVSNDGSSFVFKTNHSAPRYKLIRFSLEQPEPENWTDLVPETEHVLTSASVANNDVLLCCHLEHVKDVLSHLNLADGTLVRKVPLPGVGSLSGLFAKRSEKEVFYGFTSYVDPGSSWAYDTASGEVSMWRQNTVQGLDLDRFTVEQVFVPSKDGKVQVPMSIVKPTEFVKDSSNVALLYGYGGFNISLTPGFNAMKMALTQAHGGIYCVANMRGGGEYGEEWHQGGTKANKQNVFDDFISCAEYLITEGYTCSEKLGIEGGSNGGLLVAACVNQRPELFKCGLAAVGVMDLLKFHKFTIGSFWCSDFGCSDKPDEFPFLIASSPLHNVKPSVAYPAVLLTTADHDDRVVPLHSFKLISQLQHVVGVQPNPLLIRIEVNAGHGAGKPTSKVIDEAADKYGFFLAAVGADFGL
jgi:prolyl oligopeptidase